MARRSRLMAWLRQVLMEETDECIEWPFGRSPQGYGMVVFEGRGQAASHVACTLAHGPRPHGAHAAHECGNRACVNKRHLSWKTPTANSADQLKHGTRPYGEQRGNSKLTEDDVRRIRAVADEIVAETGASYSALAHAMMRNTWTHLP